MPTDGIVVPRERQIIARRWKHDFNVMLWLQSLDLLGISDGMQKIAVARAYLL